MALVLQAEVAGVVTGTQSNYILLDGGGVGILPVGQHVHRGNFTVDGTTGTDTANLRLTLPLASNIVWQLRTFHFTIETSTTFGSGMFEYFYAPSTTEFGASTQLNFPVVASAARTPGIVPITSYFVTQLSTSGSSAVATEQATPFGLVTFNDESAGADPVISLRSGAAPTTEGQARFAVTWLAYTYEQMRSSMLHAGFNNRN